jgi:hypothetical protein
MAMINTVEMAWRIRIAFMVAALAMDTRVTPLHGDTSTQLCG